MLHYRLQTLRLAELAQIATSRVGRSGRGCFEIRHNRGRRRIEGRGGRGKSLRDRFWAIFAFGR